jgi:hypothetical protein
MMKRITILLLMIAMLGIPFCASALDDGMSSATSVNVLAAENHSLCTGSSIDLHVPEGYDGHTFQWFLSTNMTTPIGTGTSMNVAVAATKTYCLKIFSPSDDLVAVKNYLVEALPTYERTSNVASCDRYTWATNGTTYTASGVYTINMQSVDNCDSVIHLNLTINNSNPGDTTAIVCDSIAWRGQKYYVSGDYYYAKPGAGVCVDTTTLHLTVNKSTQGIDVVTACDSTIWHGTKYYNSTSTPSFYMPAGNSQNCDSTVTLHLTINRAQHQTFTATACDMYLWDRNSSTYSVSGTFTHNYSTNGCPSVDTLKLTVNNSSTETEVVTACDSLWWHGTKYTASTNTPSVVLPHSNNVGCDSTVTLNLTINATPHKTEIYSECDSYVWPRNAKYYTASNTTDYVVGGKAPNQCDSIIHLALAINKSQSVDTSASVCDAFNWRGQNYTTSGDYINVKPGNGVCVDTTTLHLTVRRSTQGIEVVTACDSTIWHGTKYYSSTSTPTHLVATGNSQNCDSTVTLHLVINRGLHQTFTATACDNYVWSLNGTNYTASGQYTRGYTSVDGCPSVDTLKLTVNNSTAYTDVVTACDSLWWHGTKYTVSTNTPSVVLPHANSDGCDSTITLNLTIHPTPHKTEVFSKCDSYVWPRNAKYYTASNTTDYVVGGKAPNQCDSVIHLALVINNSQRVDTVAIACDAITWRGQTYASSGDYVYVKSGSGVCVDTVMLHLTVNHSQHRAFTATACDNYVWSLNGTTYTTSGQYTRDYTTVDGCPSVDTLYLTINNSTSYTDVQTVCDSLWWHGNKYVSSTGTPTFVFHNGNAKGCDSTVTLSLTVNHSSHSFVNVTECDSYYWNGVTYNTSGLYTNISTTDAGCPNVDSLMLTINHSTHDTLQEEACVSYTWNRGTLSHTFTHSVDTVMTYTNSEGCGSDDHLVLTIYETPVPQIKTLVAKHHKGSSNPWMLIYPRTEGEPDYYYQWYRNGKAIEGENMQYLRLADETAGTSVDYSVWVASSNNSVCASTSNITVNYQSDNKVAMTVFPNPSNGQFAVDVQSQDSKPVSVDIYSQFGQKILSVPMTENTKEINHSLSSGVYLLNVNMTDGSTLTEKIVIK